MYFKLIIGKKFIKEIANKVHPHPCPPFTSALVTFHKNENSSKIHEHVDKACIGFILIVDKLIFKIFETNGIESAISRALDGSTYRS